MLGFLRPADWRVLNQIVHLILIWVVKWRDSDDHLVNQDAKSPPVQGLVVARAHDHLWGKILWSATERIGLFSILLHNLGQSEICQHDVAIVVKQNVFWFKIAIDDVAFVQVTDGECNLCCIKFSFLLGESLLL